LMDNEAMKKAALKYSELTFKRAQQAMEFQPDIENLKRKCLFFNN